MTNMERWTQLEKEINDLSELCHQRSWSAGWWHDTSGRGYLGSSVEDLAIATKIALIHSEISEAMEGHRTGAMDDKLPQRTGLEVELADAVIRIGDLAGALGLDLGGAIREKLEFNKSRPDHSGAVRRAPGGKKY